MKPTAPSIKLSDYQYELPDDKIAKYPLEKRDASKLMLFEKGGISHHYFHNIPDLIPGNSKLVFNNTKVIPARMIFQKPTGARIEIFLLKPISPSPIISEAMVACHEVAWETMIGNLKRWKEGETLNGKVILNGESVILYATLTNRKKRWVRFSWETPKVSFVQLVEAGGEVPLPPYLNRKATKEDKPRYQTVYSEKEGAVAAPTAGLHFTDKLLHDLQQKGVSMDFLTLHVSAGTFQPIKVEEVKMHHMHSEQLVLDKTTIKSLSETKGNIIAVGTTSMRTLESLYWYGVKLLNSEQTDFFIHKLYPYENHTKLPSYQDSFNAILGHLEKNKLEEIIGSTEIFIFPGYRFRVCNGLITNFHQPGSTLILLVAAFTQGNWRKLYEEALCHSYRFLSYGDSNLIWYDKQE